MDGSDDPAELFAPPSSGDESGAMVLDDGSSSGGIHDSSSFTDSQVPF